LPAALSRLANIFDCLRELGRLGSEARNAPARLPLGFLKVTSYTSVSQPRLWSNESVRGRGVGGCSPRMKELSYPHNEAERHFHSLRKLGRRG